MSSFLNQQSILSIVLSFPLFFMFGGGGGGGQPGRCRKLEPASQ